MDPSIPLSLIWWHLHLPHFTSSDLQIMSKFVFYVPIVTHSQSGRSFSISVCRWLFWQIDAYFECTPHVFSIQYSSSIDFASVGYTIGKDGMCYYQKNIHWYSIQRDVRVRTNVYAGNRHLFVDNTDPMYICRCRIESSIVFPSYWLNGNVCIVCSFKLNLF